MDEPFDPAQGRQILEKLEEQNKKIDGIYKSVEKTRKYFLWVLIISIVVVVLPLVGLLFVIPQFLSLYSSLDLESMGI
jgi:type II secretory pathway component PulF